MSISKSKTNAIVAHIARFHIKTEIQLYQLVINVSVKCTITLHENYGIKKITS